MDNILKLLLGVLSVAGLIAMVIPESNPIPLNSHRDSVGMTVASQAEAQRLPPPPMLAQLDSEPISDIEIGAPAIDGNPMQPQFGMPMGTSPQISSSKGDIGQDNPIGYTPPPYILPGSAPPAEGAADVAAADVQGQ